MSFTTWLKNKVKPEVSIHLEAADIDASLVSKNGKWTLNVLDTGWEDPSRLMFHKDLSPTRTFNNITTLQAAALLALFAGYAEEPDSQALISKYLYELAEQVLEDCPNNLRIIP